MIKNKFENTLNYHITLRKLVTALEGYIILREKQKKYIGSCLGYSREEKITATETLIKHISGHSEAIITKKTYKTLNQGNLKSLILKIISEVNYNKISSFITDLDKYRRLYKHEILLDSLKRIATEDNDFFYKTMRQIKDSILVVFDYSRKRVGDQYSTVIYEIQPMPDSVLGMDHVEHVDYKNSLDKLFPKSYNYLETLSNNLKEDEKPAYDFSENAIIAKNGMFTCDEWNEQNRLRFSMKNIRHKSYSRLVIAKSYFHNSNPKTLIFTFNDVDSNQNIERLFNYIQNNDLTKSVVIKESLACRGFGNTFFSNLTLEEFKNFIQDNKNEKNIKDDDIFLIEKQKYLGKHSNEKFKVYRACAFYDKSSRYFKSINIKNYISTSIDSHEWSSQRYYGIDKPQEYELSSKKTALLDSNKVNRNLTLDISKPHLDHTFKTICENLFDEINLRKYTEEHPIKSFVKDICIYSELTRTILLDIQ